MPILGYFVWVGASLLGLLFLADSYVPRLPEANAVQYTYNIPIKAATPPGQQAVTFSGETRDFGAPPPMTVVDFASTTSAPDQTVQAPKQAQAELVTATTAKESATTAKESKPVRQKVAKRKTNRSRDLDFAHIPDNWRRDDMRDGWRRDGSMGLAFANPFFR